MPVELTSHCPECDVTVNLSADALVGEIIVCPECGVDLEIVNLQPVQLDLAPMEQEDWGE